ncbi:NAD(P)-binding protein [Nemania sp. FL0031]|nr:NAD(P)-binding protein [Nemania sp. FL0031]
MSTSKVVLVTGANNGIGYETVKAFLQSPNRYHVYLGSRSLEKGKKALEKVQSECPNTTNTVELLQLDLNSDESIERAFEVIKDGRGRLDVLINNAGGGFDGEFLQGKMSLRECFIKAYDLNVAGTNVVTWTFIPLLLKSTEPRILFVAGLSQMTQAAEGYFPTPPQPAGWPKKIDFETIGYRCSKTALSMLMLDWNHKLKEDGIKVFSVSPGFCVTGLGNVGDDVLKAMGAEHPSEGGRRLIAVAEGSRDADAGKILDKVGFLPW